MIHVQEFENYEKGYADGKKSEWMKLEDELYNICWESENRYSVLCDKECFKEN